jgi:predicted ATPase
MPDYIIAGPPCCGKSSVVEGLYWRGYGVVLESAREVIREQQPLKNPILPDTCIVAFQVLVYQHHLRALEKSRKPLRFLDRAPAIESEVYCQMQGQRLPEHFKHVLDRHVRGRYEKIFFLDPLPHYENDAERRETREQACRLGTCLEEAYVASGCDVVRVPLFPGTPEQSIDKRIRFILDHVRTRTEVPR